MALTVTVDTLHPYTVWGDRKVTFATIAFDASYPTGGLAITPADVAMSQIDDVITEDTLGYVFHFQKSTGKIMAYAGAGGTIGDESTHTHAAGAITATALNLATPAFSGTGLTAVGQVITTTSTHTMTLNECAGMWLISATGATPPNLILSNTAVVGAVAVLTVQGSANTDAGAYKIVKGAVPTAAASAAGAAHTHTSTAGANAEVTASTDLSTLTGVNVIVIGR